MRRSHFSLHSNHARTWRPHPLLLLLSLFLFTACEQLEGAGLNQPEGSAIRSPASEVSFGVSERFGGPFLNDADSPVTNASDTRVVTVEPGGRFYAKVSYEDLEGVSSIEVSLVSPDGLAGPLEPSQSFFTLGEPTGVSEPSSGCDLADSPIDGTCVYEVSVAEDAVAADVASGDDFAYTFSAKVTDAQGNTSGESERGYVEIAEVVDIPDPALEREVRQALGQPRGVLNEIDLARLVTLNASDSSIENLEGLQFAVNLRLAFLGSNNISDLSPLQSLTDLTTLILSGNDVSDLSPLRGLTNLTELNLSANDIRDIGALQNLTDLTDLRLFENDIGDLRALRDLSSLVQLDLSGNAIRDLNGLQELINLSVLDLSGNAIRDLSPLQGLSNLDVLLDLSDNEISDLNPLKNLDSLRELSLNNNDVSDLTGLQDLTNIVAIELDNNNISDVSGLQGFANFTVLSLNDNDISDISGLQGLTTLQQLLLSGNRISDLTPLQGLTQLGTLDLTNNAVSDLSGLQGIADIEFLGLSGNDISDIGPLIDNKDLAESDTVELEDNPLSPQALEDVETLRARGVSVFL